MLINRTGIPCIFLLLLAPACDDKVEGKGDKADAAAKSDGGADKGDAKAKGGGGGGGDGGAAEGGGGDGADGGGAVANATGSLKATQVAAGHSAACALMSDGTVRCWGRNNRGEHGVAQSDIDAATPVAVPGISDATDIWMGGDSGSSGDMACVRHKAGSFSCWGAVALKPRTDGKKWAETPEEIPGIKGAKDIALGGGTQYAIMPDGSVMAWGSAAFNAIGDGEASSRDKGLTQVPGVSSAKALAAGQNHACALHEDGTVTCWGYVTPKQNPKKIEGLSGVVAIGAGSGNSDTCAVMGDKTVKCWGESQEPKDEAGLSDVTLVRARNHKCAMSGDGSMRCWGYNDRGQVGTGETTGSNHKKDPVVDLGKAVHMDVGMNFVCAALEDGNAKCWGWNNRGQLGNATLIDAAKPVMVANLTADTLPAASDGSDQAQESDTEMDWSGLPADCTKPETIEAKNKWLQGDFNVASAYATSLSSGKYVNVNLATFRLDPKRPSDGPRGKQFSLDLKFAKANVETKEAFPVDKGEYIFGLKEERKVASTVRHKSGSSMLMKISLDGATPGKVTVDHIDDNWICGQLALTTKESSFTGPWAARFVKK